MSSERRDSFEGLAIALVGPLPPPAGGMANQTRQLAELLRAAGAQVELVQTNKPYRPAWVGRVPMLRALARLLPYLWALWQASGRSRLLHLMANSGWSWHLFAAPALWVARLRGVPVVVNYRGGGAEPFMRRSAGTVKASLRQAAALIVPSGFLQQVFKPFGVQAGIVPNVVDLARYRPRDAARVQSGEPHLIVTRNLEAIYDNASALRALALVRQRHPRARLTVAGSGPELASLQQLARELGIAEAVHFAGRLEREAMAGLYRDATLMLNPSLTDNTPNSVLEALASGVPVVSSDVGGVPHLVSHERTALLVPPRQPEALAAAVLRLLEDEGLRRRLSAAGLQEVQRYTWAQVAPLLARVYHQAIAGSSAKPV